MPTITITIDEETTVAVDGHELADAPSDAELGQGPVLGFFYTDKAGNSSYRRVRYIQKTDEHLLAWDLDKDAPRSFRTRDIQDMEVIA